jgi:hypothetical protein
MRSATYFLTVMGIWDVDTADGQLEEKTQKERSCSRKCTGSTQIRNARSGRWQMLEADEGGYWGLTATLRVPTRRTSKKKESIPTLINFLNRHIYHSVTCTSSDQFS